MAVKPFLVVRGVSSFRRSRIALLLSIGLSVLPGIACNSLLQGSPASNGTRSSNQPITIQSSLPSATVKNPYNTVLSVSGGRAPYEFAVSTGQLPPGLSLGAATGALSGSPTQAGSFPFTISVRGQDPGSGSRGFTMTVNSCTTCISVEVSPSSPTLALAARLQFAATVSNTSNSAVTWSASAGSITTSGLFTAPASASTASVSVTATSVVDPAARASAIVSLSRSEPLQVVTTSIPNAQIGSAYDAQLAANGGTLPYQWSILSGALPSGLQLASGSGTISGITSQAGNYSLTVRVADASAHSAQQTLALVVSNLHTNCGPPAYNCSRMDFKTVQVPTPPNVGNLIGANRVVKDPDFGNAIVRLTDWNTDETLPSEYRSFVSATSGSADENLWNLDSTLLVVQSLGAGAYPYTFNPTTMQAGRMYTAAFPKTGGMRMPESGSWSRVNPNVLYSDLGTAVYKYDFTDRGTPPSPQLMFDFAKIRNCLPAGFSATWRSRGGVSAGDTTFGMAYSDSGNQGTAVYAVAYKAGSGCTALNTQTGKVTGEWGTTGTINAPDRWMIHNVKVSKDGNWLIVAPQSCLIAACDQGPFFWQIGTTNVTSCGDGNHCGGHWTEGYTHWVNNNNTGYQALRPLHDVLSVRELTQSLPPGLVAPLDEHLSWNNADSSDTVPFFVTTWSPTKPFPSAFYNEIFGVASDGSGKMWRFAHSFITGQSPYFSTEYGIGSVSQDGRFFVFSSDWMGTLGSQSARTTCQVTVDCRGDVFVVQLN